MPHFLLLPSCFSCILIRLIHTLTNIPITWLSSYLSPKPLFTVLSDNSPCLSNVPGICFCSSWHLVGHIWQILWPIVKSKFCSKALRSLLNWPPPAFSALYMSLTLSLASQNPGPFLLLDFCFYPFCAFWNVFPLLLSGVTVPQRYFSILKCCFLYNL